MLVPLGFLEPGLYCLLATRSVVVFGVIPEKRRFEVVRLTVLRSKAAASPTSYESWAARLLILRTRANLMGVSCNL